jgi:hypothetical protein
MTFEARTNEPLSGLRNDPITCIFLADPPSSGNAIEDPPRSLRTWRYARSAQLGAEIRRRLRRWTGPGLLPTGARHAQRRHTLRVGERTELWRHVGVTILQRQPKSIARRGVA